MQQVPALDEPMVAVDTEEKEFVRAVENGSRALLPEDSPQEVKSQDVLI